MPASWEPLLADSAWSGCRAAEPKRWKAHESVNCSLPASLDAPWVPEKDPRASTCWMKAAVASTLSAGTETWSSPVRAKQEKSLRTLGRRRALPTLSDMRERRVPP